MRHQIQLCCAAELTKSFIKNLVRPPPAVRGSGRGHPAATAAAAGTAPRLQAEDNRRDAHADDEGRAAAVAVTSGRLRATSPANRKSSRSDPCACPPGSASGRHRRRRFGVIDVSTRRRAPPCGWNPAGNASHIPRPDRRARPADRADRATNRPATRTAWADVSRSPAHLEVGLQPAPHAVQQRPRPAQRLGARRTQPEVPPGAAAPFGRGVDISDRRNPFFSSRSSAVYSAPTATVRPVRRSISCRIGTPYAPCPRWAMASRTDSSNSPRLSWRRAMSLYILRRRTNALQKHLNSGFRDSGIQRFGDSGFGTLLNL
jgi:hypothetical protein